MTTNTGLRTRRSFRDVEKDHYAARKAGDSGPTELENLILAWQGIQELPPTDENSFFTIAGYHGMPFRGAGWSNSMWWGGYCYHGQILFPTWHRAYINRLESALRSIPGCENVTLPFLDWCDDETLASGLPDTLNLESFTLADGTVTKNPLYSYKFQTGVFDSLNVGALGFPDTDYTKTAGYETVRFPLSGLVGDSPKGQAAKTAEYNAQYAYPKNVQPLNDNLKAWLKNDGSYGGTSGKFRQCLDAPNYTLFSNTSSASQYNQELVNKEHPDPSTEKGLVVPLESPHNDMHLATGGYNLPTPNAVATGANGDMGENDTASFDPIFFLHHCYVDRMFWLWQLKHNQTETLTVETKYLHYPGTNNFDSQGPTPGQAAGVWLSLDSTPLEPFTKPDQKPIFSTDVVDIEGSLGYTYGPGSFSDLVEQPRLGAPLAEPQPGAQPATLAVSGINRAAISGSFVVSATGTVGGKRQLLGVESVLSRQHTQGCANCQTHLNVRSFLPLHGLHNDAAIDDANIEVKVHTHKKPEGKTDHPGLKWKPFVHAA